MKLPLEPDAGFQWQFYIKGGLTALFIFVIIAISEHSFESKKGKCIVK